jgi:outer membrane protein OmpU
MKNFLIGTSALVGAALVAVAAHAEDPKVVVGGVIDFQAAHVGEDQDAGKRAYGFRNDSEVTISVSGKSDNGLGYGAVVSLESDVTADRNNQGFNASRTYTYLDGSFGHIELGSNTGAAQSLAVEADNLARATGGIAGAWINFPNAPTSNGGVQSRFISTPGLVAEHGSTSLYGDQSTFNATKATYYSPRFSGFQVGLSLTPDLDDRGQTITRNDVAGSFGNVIEAGINYENQWDNVGLAAALTGQVGDADSAAVEDLRAWNLGTIVSFSGFSLGGSYGDWNDSGQAKGANADAHYYTLGAAYDFGPFGASATWLDSELGSNDFNNLVLGTDYSLAPGFTPYAEVSFFDADAVGTANDNDGTVVLLGTELAF